MKKLLFLFIAGSMLASCGKKFLETSPLDRKTIDAFYKTPADAYQGLVSAYSMLDQDGYGNILLTSEIASDDAFGGGGNADQGLNQWDKFINMNDINAAAWSKYYTGIYRCNILLQNINGVDFKADSTTKHRYIAEAKFLRAYYYFDLVRMFGNVPLITVPLEPGNYFIPQSTPDSVYAQIATDLKDAASNMPATAFGSIPSGEYGRATKWAAESLLGRVFLYYTGYYGKQSIGSVVSKTDATAAIEDVIQNSGYSLVPKFNNLFRASSDANGFAGQNNQEGVFVIQYTYLGLGDANQNNGNRVQVMIGIRSQVLGPYYKGWGAATVNPALYRAFQNGDTRRTSSIISIDDEGYSADYTLGDQAQYTGYFIKKYTPINDKKPEDLGGNFQWDNYDNYPVIRFADVLLMGAELNLTTNPGKAQGYLDQVRDRAFQDQAHRVTLNNVQQIMDERRFELALEGHRYWDLLRQGVSVAKSAIDNTGATAAFNVTFRPETKGLFSIPETQINLSNGTLKQNTGW
ncbi:RagB/SusD family nutrient uptake outer membrane protein [Chitinophaga sp. Cy-1792]|uniref:RagB/SusD family nutrient uptake outer membrane protein n=1 Tax=Chitinophaga sp. Cy-1792 TaxID=2608339 RepID=UPI00141DCB3F|nr:RagB/SusD family nutrient uptake outer membrane protein [Chitinophaga sp. Cy-1792]NIG54229.1 RagB/SusD family nutrient uptake outer membrane protein [Chitinophaga sp. Cy-1792]